MNLKTTNTSIKAAYHARGIRGQGIIFASIDTGVSTLVPFGRQLISAHFDALVPANGDSHGTKSASVLHSWCPDAKILVYNACSHSPDGPMINWILADILRRAQADKAHRYVVSMSWLIAGLQETHDLIKQLVALDIPVIVAAGNDGRERADRYPGSWPEPICAAALNVDGTVTGYSTWHGEMDFADQGEDVDVYGIDGRPSTYNGTSAAQPNVAGKAGLVLCENPTLTEPQLFEHLKSMARDLGATGFDPHTGWGFLEIKPGAAQPIPTPPAQEGKGMTVQKLIAYFQRAVTEKWGYVWSLNGEMYTREKAQEYHDKKRSTSSWRDPATYWLKDCARWIGKMAADCSGGIVGAIRTVIPGYGDRTANTFYNQCTDKGKIATIPEIPGLCVWRDGHIGIYEGGGNVLEFRGTEYGAVRTVLKDRNFTHWGKLRDIVYGKEESTVAKIITKNLSFDGDVQTLQTALNALGYPCGTPDGKAGDKTLAGIKAFCEAHSTLGVTLPDALTLAVEIGGKKYALDVKAV